MSEGTVKAYNSEQYQKALDKYKRLYNSQLYYDAIGSSRGGTISIGKRNLLRADCLATCGSPHHRVSRQQWSEEAWLFLAQFTKKGGNDE